MMDARTAFFSRNQANDALASQFEEIATPTHTAARIAGQPQEETHQIAQRIEPSEPDGLPVPHYAGTNQKRLEHAPKEGPRQGRHPQPGFAEEHCGYKHDQPERQTKSEPGSYVPPGPRESRALHPIPLVGERLRQFRVYDAMIDDVAGENNDVPILGDQVSQNEVFCEVMAKLFEAANLVHAALAYGH